MLSVFVLFNIPYKYPLYTYISFILIIIYNIY